MGKLTRLVNSYIIDRIFNPSENTRIAMARTNKKGFICRILYPVDSTKTWEQIRNPGFK